MDRNARYKIVVLFGVLALAIAYLLPSLAHTRGFRLPHWFAKRFTHEIQAGLDIQGGLHLEYSVDYQKAISDKMDTIANDLEDKLQKDAQVPAGAVTVSRLGWDEIDIKFANPADLDKLTNKFMQDYRDSLSEESRSKASGKVVYKVDSKYADDIKSNALAQAVRTLRDRVDAFGVAEPTIVKKGDKIVVELPGDIKKLLAQENAPASQGLTAAATAGAEDPIEHLKEQIGRTAQLEWKIVDDGTDYMKQLGQAVEADPKLKGIVEIGTDSWSEGGDTRADVYLKTKVENKQLLLDYLHGLAGQLAIPADHEILLEDFQPSDEYGVELPQHWVRTYLLKRRPSVSGDRITDAQVAFDPQTQRPEVEITLDRQGGGEFEKLSGDNVGRKLAIVLDNQIKSAPVLESKIPGGHVRITLGGGDRQRILQDAQDLVNVLRAGALPAPLNLDVSRVVGPTLGGDAIHRALDSMLVGAIAVVLFTLIYYRWSGFIAVLAMFMNVLLQLAILAGFDATMTLPGIAGVVLTIGMAVDANIIIYERIREELRAGKTPRNAVEAGFSRAFWTVFDAHITNAVAGFVLLSYGTGPIRGFAVTLLIGVACNLFTSVWCSRAMFEVMVGRRRHPLETLSI